MARIERLGAWPARVLWLLLALASGATFGDALDGRSVAVRVVCAVLLWAGWAAGSVALLVPRTASLTAVRLLVPAGLAATTWAAGTGEVGALDAASVAVAALAVLAVAAPWVAEGFVDGSAYGPERRTPLRTPPVIQLLVAPATWALVVAGAVAGPVLIAGERWVPGALALGAGWPLAWAGTRSLHELSRRWVVIVPAGLVIQDPLTMPEPQLFLRRSIRHLGPAERASGPPGPDGAPQGRGRDGAGIAQDLTAGAAGLAFELDLDEPIDLLLRSGRTRTRTASADRILFTPTRPLTVLEAAGQRRIPIG